MTGIPSRYSLSIVRDPLLGRPVPAAYWGVACMLAFRWPSPLTRCLSSGVIAVASFFGCEALHLAHIRLFDVGVEFPIHNSHSRSLQLQVFGKLGGKLAQHKQAVFVQALQNVNLAFEDGDRVGIIGHNGAGKTTLLRVLAGVYEPTFGTMSIEGRLSSFTDITLGMDPEATGLDNIIFRCVFMGLSFAEARRLSPSIQEFSELGEFLRLPDPAYSRKPACS